MPLPLTAGLPQDGHKPPVGEQDSPAISRHFPCCPFVWRVRSPLGQLPRLAKTTVIYLGVGCERKSIGLVVGLSRKPLLLFRHRGGVRSEEGKSVGSIVEYQIIRF